MYHARRAERVDTKAEGASNRHAHVVQKQQTSPAITDAITNIIGDP